MWSRIHSSGSHRSSANIAISAMLQSYIASDKTAVCKLNTPAQQTRGTVTPQQSLVEYYCRKDCKMNSKRAEHNELNELNNTEAVSWSKISQRC